MHFWLAVRLTPGRKVARRDRKRPECDPANRFAAWPNDPRHLGVGSLAIAEN
jgi:hypothetical protein